MKRSWVKLEVESIEDRFEQIDLPKEIILDSEKYKKLEESYRDIDVLLDFLAYIYQARKAMASIRKSILKSDLPLGIKATEGSLLLEDLESLAIMDEFFLNKGKTREGYITIELGLDVVKTFNASRQYLLLKICLENIYDSILEIIDENSNEDIKKIINIFKYVKIKDYSKFIFKDYIIKNKMTSNQILENLIGAELLVLSLALADKNLKHAFLSLTKIPNDSIFYERIDEKIFRFLKETGLEEGAKEVTSKFMTLFMFSQRKLC